MVMRGRQVAMIPGSPAGAIRQHDHHMMACSCQGRLAPVMVF
jgi:hypothetical protein